MLEETQENSTLYCKSSSSVNKEDSLYFRFPHSIFEFRETPMVVYLLTNFTVIFLHVKSDVLLLSVLLWGLPAAEITMKT